MHMDILLIFLFNFLCNALLLSLPFETTPPLVFLIFYNRMKEDIKTSGQCVKGDVIKISVYTFGVIYTLANILII